MIPQYFYGTAWKEDATADLVYTALKVGFRAIDTANQRKHYFESAVGEGLARFLEEENENRSNVFLQTKFTYSRGQDHRKPYDDAQPFAQQVASSFQSSLQNLRTDYIDSYVLHGPYNVLVGSEDRETWGAMERLVAEKKVRALGLSNVGPQQLLSFYEQSKIKPSFVQNRCFARLGWDREIRNICQTYGIHYQGFSLLTANQYELQNPEIAQLAKKYNRTIPQIIFKFSQQVGIICLTGTTQIKHMQDDLSIDDFEMSPHELRLIENISF